MDPARVIAVVCLCVACRPGLDDTKDPPVEEDSGAPDDTDDSAEPDDTATVAACPRPESEPNDTPDEADALPTDVWGCGGFDRTSDADNWTFTFDEEGWIGVEVKAFRVGSDADVSLSIVGETTGISLGQGAWLGQPDPFVRFPSPAGTYRVSLRQVVGGDLPPGAGDDHFYEVLATSTKPPLDWQVDEDADATAPQPLVDGPTPRPVTVLGAFGEDGDADVYAVTVPAGRHRLELDVDAHELGSVANTAIRLESEAGALLALVQSGRLGFEQDPFVTWTSLGGETLHVRVIKEGDPQRSGPAYWYALSVDLEAE